MRKKIICSCAVLSCAAVIAAPVLQFDFDKNDKKNSYSADRKYRLSARVLGPGFKGKGADADSARRLAFRYPAAGSWKSFTFEMRFKLDKGVDQRRGNALICYGKNSWNRSQFLLMITRKGQLEARFTQVARKEEIFAASKVLNFEPGRFYTVRVASQDGGALKIWLDNELVVMKEKGSWGMNRLVPKSVPQGYPLLVFGSDLARLPAIFRPLNGTVDDIKVWNKFKEPDLIGDIDAAGDKALLVSENKRVTTEKFMVLDRPGTALGSFIRPEQKFLDAAASATLKLTARDLIVRVKAPIASGTQLDRRPNLEWSGDVIEFFFHPEPGKGDYYQYAANVSGYTAAMNFSSSGLRKRNFKSRSQIKRFIYPDRWEAEFIVPRSEIGLAGKIDGRICTANFTRSGQSGGGKSTWSPVGNVFHSPSRFRPVVFGSYKAALLGKYNASRAEFNALKGKKELKKAIAAELDAILKRINSDGSKAEFFSPLSQAIDRMVPRYTQLRFSGSPTLLWSSPFPWGNDIQVSPLAQPLKKISLVLPKNSFTYFGFVFSNLSEKPFLGQIKCFPLERFKNKRVYNEFNNRIWGDRSPLYRSVKFFEALPVISGGTIYDPLLPLHLNTLLRAGVNESKQVWMRVSSKGLPAGKHRMMMVLKPSYAGFPPVEIPVEIDVRNVDLKGIKLDSFHYTFINNRAPKKELLNFLAEKELNVIYSGGAFGQSAMDVYPQVDKNGNVLSYASYAMWDNLIETKVKAGIPRERIKLLCWLELPSYGMRKKGNKLRFNTPAWKKAFRSFLFHFTGYMEKKHGITKDRIIFYTTDEPHGDINDKSSKMYKAYLSGKIIKEIGKEFRTMVNPSPYYLRGKDISAFKKLAEVYDIFELYRPALKKNIVETVKTLNREIWTYGIYMKVNSPDIYRREYWQSFADGFTSMISYWHLDSHAGGDGFNSEDGVRSRADYGSIFVDMDMGTVLSSRREEAHELGKEDFKLAVFCRNALKKKPDARLQKELDTIVRKAYYGTMADMENGRLKLIELAEKLIQRK